MNFATLLLYCALVVCGALGLLKLHADDMAICQLSHSEAVCFHALNR